jgi:membrane associated rhomboid family serine protease
MSGGVSGSAQPPEQPGPGAQPGPRCYRHTDRETYISCQRCGRPICPDCMRAASVGFQCPECVAEGRASTPQPRTVYGGAVRARENAVTLTLIAINVAVFLAVTLTGGRVLESTMMYPAGVAAGQWWRLLTSVFLHQAFLHLVFNMVALWIFGPVMERLLGRVRFLALYLLSGLAGSVAVYLLSAPFSFTLGASGAVFGLLGAALVVTVRRGYDASWLLGLLGINLVITFTIGTISWQGHLGGLIGGLVLGAALAWAPRRQRTLVHVAAFVAMFGLCVLLIVVRTGQLAAA